MKVFVLSVVLALASAAPQGRDDLSKLEEEETQYSPQPFAYNYNIADEIGAVRAAHVEEGDGNGKVRGSYSYVRPDGVLQTVSYVADENGFRPEIVEETAPVFESADPFGTSKFTVQLPHAEVFGVELSAEEYEQYKEAARLRELESQSQSQSESQS
ncbi:cuticle protein CP14.6-like [Penaeus japonicus]|uniref:cuticle protein CP14.6-like n=1 Tax=Penaeus japonicus TaxID=27405 RepID=UPI001C7164A5|nr:cuticle protein CP14.6-like [Penaeus japonicus]